MRTAVAFALLLLLALPRLRATEIGPGVLTENTRWRGEIRLTGTVTVAPGVSLVVEPGTRVCFAAYRGYREPDRRIALRVQGSLTAEGTAKAPVCFTSAASDPCNGDWSMLRLESPTGPCSFRFAVFEFAQQGLNVWRGEVRLSQCVFRWNNWEGVYLESDCRAALADVRIYENGYNGLAAEQFNQVTMDRCEVYRNGTNGVHVDASTAEIRRSRVYENRAHGLSTDGNATLRARGVALERNGAWGIGIGEGNNVVEIGGVEAKGNGAGGVAGPFKRLPDAERAPPRLDFPFQPESDFPLGYIPGDRARDRYRYVYPDDETRTVERRIGEGLGLTWSVAYGDGTIWTATLTGEVFALDPRRGTVLRRFRAPGPQPWGMTHDGRDLWLVDFAEKRLSRLDPATGRETATFPTPDPASGCKGVAWDGTCLNVLGWSSPCIYRMSREGRLLETIPLDHGGGGGIAWDGEHFWVSGAHILEYDREGHAVGWIHPASEGTWDLAWDGRLLWAAQRTNENWDDAKLFALRIGKRYPPD